MVQIAYYAGNMSWRCRFVAFRGAKACTDISQASFLAIVSGNVIVSRAQFRKGISTRPPVPIEFDLDHGT
jgi:hypothetical protein